MDKKVKPKQYSHIDYEAILIYMMQQKVSLQKTLDDHNLDIARSTFERNINKIDEKSNGQNKIINLYKNGYVPNMQKQEMPEEIKRNIDLLESRDVVVKDELQELYDKLSKMKAIVEQCNGNYAEATRQINSGNTILGNVHITRQGLGKDLSRYELVKETIEKRNKQKNEEKEKE